MTVMQSSDFARRISGLTPKQRAVLAARLKEDGSAFNSFPLSFAQERLWFIEQLAPGSPLYNLPTALRVEGRLAVPALEQCLSEIVRRHEVLRTSFHELNGEAVQFVNPARPLAVRLVDLTGLPDAERAAAARQLREREALRPFDLSAPPLLRATLLRLGEREHVLLLSMHHIAADGWSMDILARETAALYRAFDEGTTSTLADLEVQYADFAQWQRRTLGGEALATQIDYWKRRLAGAPPLLELPTDRPRPAVQTFNGDRRELELPAELVARLRALGREEGATLFNTLLAAFKALLFRYTGQEDLSVGTPVAGRDRTEVAGLIGLFVNTLVVRTAVSGGEEFRALLRRVRDEMLEAFAHKEAPFEKLVEELRPERSLNHAPLFQVMFTLQNAPRESLELPGLAFRAMPGGAELAKFDLGLVLAERPAGEVSCVLHFNTDLFDASTAERMLGHYRTLLEGAAEQSSLTLSSLPILTEDERARLTREWNDPRAEEFNAPPVHTLFEARAAETPDAVALNYAGRDVSFGELNRRANRLAHELLALGVGPETRVGLCAERSADLVAGLLAVFKAGGAYVPLDPSYPRERLSFMLEDARVSVLLTESRLAEGFEGRGAHVMLIDNARGGAVGSSEENPGVPVSGRDLAYMIYTSGTTGRPKAVMVEHANLSSTLAAAQAEFGFNAGDVMPCVAPFSFDISLFELLMPVLAGGRAALLTREEVLDLPRLASALEGFTALHTLPSLMRQLVDEARARGSRYERLRMVFVGGDLVPPDLLEDLKEVFPAARVRVLYGPTEGTIICSSHLVPAGRRATGHLIGRPLRNAALHLFDAAGNLVPVGVPGEIFIGGAGVARGYWEREELTREKYPTVGGQRFYRTGDLARWRADGEMEFLGRTDGQVKIRGYRIELGEVEAALKAHAGVGACVVVAREDAPGDRRLAAYVVAAEASAATRADDLRRFVQERLPDYMTPSAFVFLAELPLTPNGKVDRKALPAPESARPGLAEEFAAPRTPTEEVLAAVWREVLGAGRVGVEDNFFDLGGHSLLATQLISRVRDRFGAAVPLRALFDAPTVAGLAARIDETLRGPAASTRPPITRAERGGELPLSFAQQRLWFFDQLEPGSVAFNIHAGVRLGGALNAAALAQSLGEVVRRHEALRTSFSSNEGRPAQVVAEAARVPVPFVDLRGLSAGPREEVLAGLARRESLRPFDLSKGPLLRPALLRLKDEEHVLLVTMHHIISDGWSAGLLVRELVALYESFSRGGRSPLAELQLQYADYSVWQREWLQGGALEELLSYWRRQLEGAPPVLELPADRPRPQRQTFRGGTHSQTLAHALSEGLRELTRGEGATLFMTLLAAFDILLRHQTGRGDLVVGTDVANRGLVETEPLIGFFVNHLVLRTRLEGGDSFRDVLGRVRETALGAYAHQDLPFERLVEAVNPGRSLAHAPLFQVKFTLQNAPSGTAELAGLTLKPLAAEREVAAKLDLTLLASEQAGGLRVFYEYNADLFDASTVARTARLFESLLNDIVERPGATVDELTTKLAEAERRERAEEKKRRDEAKFARLRAVRPKPLGARPEALVRAEPLMKGSGLPLVYGPAVPDLDLVKWAAENRAAVEQSLAAHGALLFRGFPLDPARDFEPFAAALCSRLFRDNGEHPRQSVSGNVYTPVFYPQEQKVLWHNENSFNHEWPARIWFCCVRPADAGGETPVADSRRVFERIDPSVRDEFVRKGVMYVRNYGRGLGLSWQEVFRTEDRAAVEEVCRAARTEFEWRTGGQLKTRAVRPAAVRHPRTGEWVWFNQAQHWHVACLDAATSASLRSLFAEEDLPRACYYGDGTSIDDAAMAHILEVYRGLEVSFAWRPGDIMMLDNLLAAHARNPFAGERRLLVAMGDMLSYDAVERGGR